MHVPSVAECPFVLKVMHENGKAPAKDVGSQHEVPKRKPLSVDHDAELDDAGG